MKQFIKYGLPVVVGLIGLTASADPITGSINMTAVVTPEVGGVQTTLSQATSLVFAPGTGSVNLGATGSFSGTGNTSVSFANFTFSPVGASTPFQLWTFSTGVGPTLETYSFQLGAITSVVKNDDSFINFMGSGTVSIVGNGTTFDPTFANWTATVTDSANGGVGETFLLSFGQSDTSIPSPDGGATVMMLGAALTGLGLIKRKLA